MRFTLTIVPDGHAILSTTETVSPADVERIREIFDRWRETTNGVVVAAQTEVVVVEDVTLEIEEA